MQSFWAKAWGNYIVDTLANESSDPRLSPARTLVRKGRVLGFSLDTGRVEALINDGEPYEVLLKVEPLNPEGLSQLKKFFSWNQAALGRFLGGVLPDNFEALEPELREYLYPSRRELKVSCTCYDDALVCKHALASFYFIATMLEKEPGWIFAWRQVNLLDLLARDSSTATAQAQVNLFGIDLVDDF